MVTEAPEIKSVSSKRVSCDGDGGALGHPRIYLDMGDDTEIECPYCGRKFIFDPKAT